MDIIIGRDFVIGASSSAAVTIIAALLAYLWPRFKASLRREAKISGAWIWYDCTGSNPVGSLQIKQIGSRITGTLTRSVSLEGTATSREFKLAGEISGPSFLATYTEPDDPSNVRGAIVAKILTGRKYLYAHSLYFTAHRDEIKTEKHLFSREQATKTALEYLSAPGAPSKGSA